MTRKKKPIILVIDDEKDIFDDYKDYPYIKRNYECIYLDGKDENKIFSTIRRKRTRKIELIILDLYLDTPISYRYNPLSNPRGLRVLKDVKDNYFELPVIVISHTEDPKLYEKTKAYGADAIVLKYENNFAFLLTETIKKLISNDYTKADFEKELEEKLLKYRLKYNAPINNLIQKFIKFLISKNRLEETLNILAKYYLAYNYKEKENRILSLKRRFFALKTYEYENNNSQTMEENRVEQNRIAETILNLIGE